ncbi:MAG: hypothetical protein PHP37_03170 [Patescibacteria group bacterium]|nr:hypothetical protein [Patescibacteria group bacterium]
MKFEFFSKKSQNKEDRFPEKNMEGDSNYWEKIDQEFALPAQLFSNYLKKIGKEKKVEDIIHEWQKELIDWRTKNGESPIQNVEKDITDLRELLTIKAENNLLSKYATADSCYYDHLLLLSLGTSELHKNPELQYKKDEDVDWDEILDVAVNEGIKNTFYSEAKSYLRNDSFYNRSSNRKYKYNLEKHQLDSDALIVLNELKVLDAFYNHRDYVNEFESLPSFVADDLIKRKERNELYFHHTFNKFESFSNLVAKDIFNDGRLGVVGNLLEDFDRFPETDPLWVLEKVLKCGHFISNKSNSLISLINEHIKTPEDIKKAYKLIISHGIIVEDEDISNIFSEKDKFDYKKKREQFIFDITKALGDNDDHRNHKSIKDLDKFYEMAENGYGPVLLERTGNCYINFDKNKFIEKLKKNNQSSYCLNYIELQSEISISNLVKNIINEGDIDVLAASLGSLDDGPEIEQVIIKLWESGYEDAVKKNIKGFRDLSDDVARLLVDSDNYNLILSNIKNFNLSNNFLRSLIDNYGENFSNYDIDLKYLENKEVFDYFFEKVNNPEVLKKLIFKGFSALKEENRNKLAEAISKTEAFEDFLSYALSNDCLSDMDFQVLAINFDNVIEKNGKGDEIISFVKNIKNKPEDSFYVQNKEFFSDEINRGLISFFILLFNRKILSKNQEDLEIFLATGKELADKLIEAGDIGVLIANLEKFKGLDQEMALKLLGANGLNKIIDNIEVFSNLSRDFGQELIKLADQFSKIVKINDYYNPPLDKMVSKTSEIFGSFASAENFNLIKGVDSNDKEIVKKLKLKKGGNDGLRELQERFSNFKREIISEDFNPEILLQEDNKILYLPYFQSYIRYNESQWGKKDEENFKKIIGDYVNYKNKGELKGLNPNFTSSPELSIARSDEGARDKYQFNEHFLNRFSVLVNSIKNAKNLYQEKFPLSKLVKEIEEKRKSLISELKSKSDNMPNPQAKEGISQKINLLESVNIRSVKDFQENFYALARNKEFNELLRQVVFLISFSRNKQALDFDLDAVNLEKPKLDDISWTLDFIDHITNQETMDKYFTDKKSKKIFNEIISAQAISDEMVLLQSEGGQSGGTTKIQLIPTRGILNEFSGYVADACWASKYDSVAKEFPNFTSVIIRQNPDNKYERLAGAFLLIETESKRGDRLLVIRGLNPIENLINSLSVKDFYDKTIDYLKQLAKNDNRKLAIVIDEASGGSATNRKVLFNYLEELSKKLEAIDLKSEKDTTFNGLNHNIVRKTYLVD